MRKGGGRSHTINYFLLWNVKFPFLPIYVSNYKAYGEKKGIYIEIYSKKYNSLPETTITESQFAQIVGRARLYQNMPYKDKKELPVFPLMDSQVNLVVKDYYSDKSFCKDDYGNLNCYPTKKQ